MSDQPQGAPPRRDDPGKVIVVIIGAALVFLGLTMLAREFLWPTLAFTRLWSIIRGAGWGLGLIIIGIIAIIWTQRPGFKASCEGHAPVPLAYGPRLERSARGRRPLLGYGRDAGQTGLRGAFAHVRRLAGGRRLRRGDDHRPGGTARTAHGSVGPVAARASGTPASTRAGCAHGAGVARVRSDAARSAARRLRLRCQPGNRPNRALRARSDEVSPQLEPAAPTRPGDVIDAHTHLFTVGLLEEVLSKQPPEAMTRFRQALKERKFGRRGDTLPEMSPEECACWYVERLTAADVAKALVVSVMPDNAVDARLRRRGQRARARPVQRRPAGLRCARPAEARDGRRLQGRQAAARQPLLPPVRPRLPAVLRRGARRSRRT